MFVADTYNLEYGVGSTTLFIHISSAFLSICFTLKKYYWFDLLCSPQVMSYDIKSRRRHYIDASLGRASAEGDNTVVAKQRGDRPYDWLPN